MTDRRKSVRRTAAVFALLLSAASASAQTHRLVPLDHWAYEYIQRLQRRGHLLELHPTALPYTRGEIAASVRQLRPRELATSERTWARALKVAFDRTDGRRSRSRHALGGGELEPGVRFSNHDRLHPVRYLDADDASLHAAGLNFYPKIAGQAFLQYGPIVAQAGLRFDTFYQDDPDGLDAANRLIVRNEENYAGFASRYVSVYLGRFRHHWAPADDDALLLSDNAVDFDHINLRIGGRRLALRSILGELDSMTADGRYTGTAGADSVTGSVRRFVAAHRFDWRPTRSFSLSIMESTIYSSNSSGLSLKFLNPLNLQAFSVDGRPKNDENNGLLAGMLWFQHRRVTVQGQLLLDDVDLMGQTGEPPSAALSGSLLYAGWPRLDLGGRLTAVTARTYNTHQPEGRYVYLLRGLGTQFSDYVSVSGFGTVYPNVGPIDAAVTPKLDLLWQGARDIREPYPRSEDDVGTILTGETTRFVRPGVEVRLQGGRHWWMTADAGVLFSENDDARFTVVGSFSARLGVLERIDLSL